MFLKVSLLIYTLSSTVFCEIEKCCDFNEQLEYNSTNNEFICVKQSDKRVVVVANSTNFLKSESNGTCYDVVNSTFYARIDKGKEINNSHQTSGFLLLESYFSKCCPLNFVYNQQRHACDSNTDYSIDINKNFVKIGLPDCRIVQDFIYNSTELLNESISAIDSSYCTDRSDSGDYVLRKCEDSTEICNGRKCVRKCCPDGQAFGDGTNCIDDFETGLNMSFSKRVIQPEDPFAIVYKYECEGLYYLYESTYNFNLTKEGLLDYQFLDKPLARFKFDFDMRISYCIEDKNDTFEFFMCYPEYPSTDKFIYTEWAKIASCISLVLTIMIYLVLKKTNNLFGKSLVGYCFTELMTMGLLLYVHIDNDIPENICPIIAYFLLFLVISEFSWLNILCYDIWKTFGSTNRGFGSSNKSQWKRFYYYNLYAWGLPSFIIFLIGIFNIYIVLPYEIHPFMGIGQCFLEQRTFNYAKVVFKNGPLLIMEIANTALFVRTVVYCLKVKKEINKINDTNVSKNDKTEKLRAAKEQILLIFKLSILMGLSFLFEVISSFFDMSRNPFTKYVEIVWDTVNCLQGLFIFIIFILKKQVINEVLILLHIKSGLDASKSTTTLSTMSSTTG